MRHEEDRHVRRFEPKWTLVQHSAAGYKGDPQFDAAVESMGVTTAAELRLVRAAGGAVYDDYGAAEDAAMAENYPDGYDGMTPQASGKFAHDKRIDGLRIYVPAVEYRLVVTDKDGTVIDSADVTRGDLLRAQTNGMTARSILEGLSLGTQPGEAR